MIESPDISRLARTIGDATRLRMLTLLMDGRALTAKELAYTSGVEPSTATAHLRRLVGDGFLRTRAQGRHKYFRLASPDVARFIESLMVVAPETRELARTGPAGDPLRQARYCYDHLAGRLGTRLTQALLQMGWIKAGRQAFTVTPTGRTGFADFGVDLAAVAGSRRKAAYPCLDWSERREHLGGALGSALAVRMTRLGWIERKRESRAVTLTPAGKRALAKRFGVRLA